MIPGQLRPSFIRNDRLKRYCITTAAVIVGVCWFVGRSALVTWLPFLLAFVVMLVLMQIYYHRRIRNVRRVATRIAEAHPASRVVVGNVRFVGPVDSGPRAADFATTIVEVGTTALRLWNPDAPERPVAEIPLEGIRIDVTKTNPPRLRIETPDESRAIHVALFGDKGLSLVKADALRSVAAELFPSNDGAVAS